MRKTTIATASALTLLAFAVPVTMAESRVMFDTPISSEDYALSGRPMDDIEGTALAYGDLSVFDTIDTYGASQSSTEPYCDVRPTLVSTLDHDFAEKATMKTPLENNRSVELFTSDVMGTWTAIYTRSDGISCVISSGIDWEHGRNPVALLEEAGVDAQG